VLDELRASGLALDRLPGNTAKIRLALDLVRFVEEAGSLRVLDVGCAGPNPLNLWEPLLRQLPDLRVAGVDVAGLDRAERRAAELGIEIELLRASALELSRVFPAGSFDAVVSTQVLEHVRDWRRALREAAAVVRPGGRVFVTCDSGDRTLPLAIRIRLALKRLYSRLPARMRVAPFSGEWERGPRAAELRAAAEDAGLEVELVTGYCLPDAKAAQRTASPSTRPAWFVHEEELRLDGGGVLDPRAFSILYLRARRPGMPA
jgi:2-polyprenyl-3-methyl-5-hydroxy-6-metoxy-1,4-benzoquinol methylase